MQHCHCSPLPCLPAAHAAHCNSSLTPEGGKQSTAFHSIVESRGLLLSLFSSLHTSEGPGHRSPQAEMEGEGQGQLPPEGGQPPGPAQRLALRAVELQGAPTEPAGAARAGRALGEPGLNSLKPARRVQELPRQGGGGRPLWGLHLHRGAQWMRQKRGGEPCPGARGGGPWGCGRRRRETRLLRPNPALPTWRRARPSHLRWAATRACGAPRAWEPW